jgi:pimeloyl-ACP methyl ester carboxylesterase
MPIRGWVDRIFACAMVYIILLLLGCLMIMTNSTYSNYRIENHKFKSKGITCDGDLYLPSNVEMPPIVVMAHGFGSERVLRLPAYAEYFSQNGIAVFLFDYRGFGPSEGKPRNLVSPKHHIQDWANAIAYVRTLQNIDTNRIALWGSSYSGGHVLVTASKEPDLAGIVAQVPFVDAGSTVRRFKLSFILKSAVHALWDGFKALFGAKPHNIKIVGLPNEFAALNTPDAWGGMLNLIPPGYDIEAANFCPARALMELITYKPIKKAHKINCPVLIMGSKTDTLIDINAVRKTVKKISNCQFYEYECGHFDLYVGDLFEDSVPKQLKFFKECFN